MDRVFEGGVMRRRLVLGGLAALGGLPVAGCDAPARLAALPGQLRGHASFKDLPADARFILDGGDDGRLADTAVAALRREIADAEKAGRQLGDADYLAISGGGENGAFGAGLLTEWSALGTRPEFKAVTGVSTGALIAPFAFLGPAHDGELERFYTTISRRDVMVSRGLLSGVMGESLYESAPLLRLIRGTLTPAFVAAIAAQHRRGRLLFVATTNLDVPVGVLWNIGAIAADGGPGASETIARILLASASIPGVLPPVMIDLEAGGGRFQEMHVDGGTVAQVVMYPPSFGGDLLLNAGDADGERLRRALIARKRRIYVIRNARPGPDLETIDRSTLKIAGRAVATLIGTQGIGDLYQLYVLAQRDGLGFNAAWIPSSFAEKPSEPFERGYMNRLYQVGRVAMRDGRAWHRYPPGYDPTPFSQIRQ
jgi:hypothetical protein